MAQKEPYICEPTDASSGRPATFIFLHGYGDDAQGLPLGVAQQFQFHSKLPYLKWLLPNAPHNFEAMAQAWYMPKALPNALKPRVPGHDEEAADENAADDEEGILNSVDTVDRLVEQEIENGVDPERIIVGGFSQGCAVSLVWGVTGRMRNKVAGVVCLSGYFPLTDRIEKLMADRGVDERGEDTKTKKWLYAHGSKDMLVPIRLFEQGKQELAKYVKKEDVEDHIYEGMSHTTGPAELRDMLFWLQRVVPP